MNTWMKLSAEPTFFFMPPSNNRNRSLTLPLEDDQYANNLCMSKQFATLTKAKLILENSNRYWIDFVCHQCVLLLLRSLSYGAYSKNKQQMIRRMFITLYRIRNGESAVVGWEKRDWKDGYNVMWMLKEQHQHNHPSGRVIISTKSSQLASRLFFSCQRTRQASSFHVTEFITIILMHIESVLMGILWKGWEACRWTKKNHVGSLRNIT